MFVFHSLVNFRREASHIINDDKVVSEMKINSEYCQLKRMYAEWVVRTMAVLTLAGSFSGCAALQSSDSQVQTEERLKKQAEIKASLYTEENTDVKNTPTFDKSTSLKKNEIDKTPQHVLFNAEDFSRYATQTSNWLAGAFSWSKESSDEPFEIIEPETDNTSEPIILYSGSIKSSVVNDKTSLIKTDALEVLNVNNQALAQNLDQADKEGAYNQQVYELLPHLISKNETTETKIEIIAEPVLVTEVLSQVLSNDIENKKLITAINTMTNKKPSAAGISMEAFEQETRLSIRSENTKTSQKKVSEPLVNPLVGNSNAIKSWNGCSVASPTFELNSPDYTTQMWLNVFEDHLMVNTTTNIDINMKQVGIKIDNGKLQKFTSKLYASNVVWSADIQTIMKNHKSLKIIIGGDELGRNRQTADVSMAELKALYLANTRCSD